MVKHIWLGIWSALLLSLRSVGACSCFGPISLDTTLDRVEYALRVWVRNEIFPYGPLDAAGNGDRYYRADVHRTFQECGIDVESRILIRTGGNSALCGYQLREYTVYFLTGYLDDDQEIPQLRSPQQVLSVYSCDYQSRWFSMPRSERREMNSMDRTCTTTPDEDIIINPDEELLNCDVCPNGFFDGCNNCGCENNSAFCTERFCAPEDLTEPVCFPDEGFNCDVCPNGFFDGCNNCGCDNNLAICTLRACSPDELTESVCFPSCASCASGAYFDGCNICSCGGENDEDACSRKACLVYEEPYCI